MTYDTIVIGGGASGMMAAIFAAQNEKSVLLIEKNSKLGVKLSISGGGRCNILNDEEDLQTLLGNYGEAKKFLFSAYEKFGVKDTKEFFESCGLPLKTEALKRSFPVSDSAKDVVNTLKNQLIKYGVEIKTEYEVKGVNFKSNRIEYIQLHDSRVAANNYILATGGTSRPETGSTGDGFKWLKESGHNVKDPTPNITPLKASSDWLVHAQGQKLKSSKITFYLNGKKAFDKTGDILVAHFGISGPVILNSAQKVSGLLNSGAVTAKIDLFPKLDHNELDTKIRDVLSQNATKNFTNSLKEIVSLKTINSVANLLSDSVDFSKNSSEISKVDRKKVVNTLKELPISITSLMGFEKAVVADGGVSLKDIDTRTMRSRKIDNLFVTGDLLNINRPSGGYSLQLCWTTGYIAGNTSAK